MYKSTPALFCASAIGVLLTTSAMAGSPHLTGLLREGDVLPEGLVGGLDSPAANRVGGFAIGTSIGGVESIWGNANPGAGAILRQQMTFGDLVQGSFEFTIGLADDGTICYSPSVTNTATGASGLDSIWFGDTPLILEEDVAPDFAPDFYSFGSRPGTTRTDPTGIAGLTDTLGGSTDYRALMIGSPPAPVVAGSDVVPGLPAPIGTGGSIDFNYRVSGDGTKWIMEAIMATGSSLNDGAIIDQDGGVLAGGALMREGDPIPGSIGGLAGENWDNFDFFGTNDNGDMLITGDSDGDAATDEFLFVNGTIVIREGDVVDGEMVQGSIEAGGMNESGDWAVVWDILEAGSGIEALFINGALVAREGDAIDFDGDGTVDPAWTIDSFTGITSLAVGARDATGFNVYGTVDATDTVDVREVFYCVRITTAAPCPCDFDADGAIGVNDLLALLAGWGGPAGDCNGDNITDVNDLLMLLSAWGPC